MANEIKDLNGLMKAVGAEWDKMTHTAGHFGLGFRDANCGDHLKLRCRHILNDEINEADYIKQWSEVK